MFNCCRPDRNARAFNESVVSFGSENSLAAEALASEKPVSPKFGSRVSLAETADADLPAREFTTFSELGCEDAHAPQMLASERVVAPKPGPKASFSRPDCADAPAGSFKASSDSPVSSQCVDALGPELLASENGSAPKPGPKASFSRPDANSPPGSFKASNDTPVSSQCVDALGPELLASENGAAPKPGPKASFSRPDADAPVGSFEAANDTPVSSECVDAISPELRASENVAAPKPGPKASFSRPDADAPAGSFKASNDTPISSECVDAFAPELQASENVAAPKLRPNTGSSCSNADVCEACIDENSPEIVASEDNVAPKLGPKASVSHSNGDTLAGNTSAFCIITPLSSTASEALVSDDQISSNLGPRATFTRPCAGASAQSIQYQDPLEAQASETHVFHNSPPMDSFSETGEGDAAAGNSKVFNETTVSGAASSAELLALETAISPRFGPRISFPRPAFDAPAENCKPSEETPAYIGYFAPEVMESEKPVSLALASRVSPSETESAAEPAGNSASLNETMISAGCEDALAPEAQTSEKPFSSKQGPRDSSTEDAATMPDSFQCCCTPARNSKAFKETVVDVESENALSATALASEQLTSVEDAQFDKIPAIPMLQKTDRELKESRVRDAVLIFSMQAVRGCPCTYLKERAGERLSATYFIDSSATKFVVKTDDDLSCEAVSCPLRSVLDIYVPERDGEESFPPAVLSMLGPEERRCLFMVVFGHIQGAEEKKIRFCLLAESSDARDRCLQCLPLLGMYAQKRELIEKGVPSQRQFLV